MRGLLRGLIWGFGIALIVGIGLAFVARYAPYLLVNAVLRVAFAFIVTWLLFAVVQEAAGMTGYLINTIVICSSLMVMLSHHVIWAVWGVPSADGLIIGFSVWFSPGALFIPSLFWCIGMIGCTALCHSGVPGPDIFGHIMTLHLRGTRR